MNELEAIKYLDTNITFNANEQTYTAVQYFFNEFNTMFGFDNFEVVQIINKEPMILKLDCSGIIKNLKSLGGVYNIKSLEFKNLVMKCPSLLLLGADELSRKIELVKTVFGCEFLAALKIIYLEPRLLGLTKEFVEAQIYMLSKELDLYGLEIRKLFSVEHRMIYVTQNRILELKRYFMHSFGLDDLEVARVIKSVPEILFDNQEDIEKRFDDYYPNLFIKRDIKEILVNCPEFIKIDSKMVCEKISKIQEFFGVEKKKACEFVRRFPDILFYSDIDLAINKVLKLGINKNYLFAYPNCIGVQSIALKVKFIIARILDTEKEFNNLINLPLSELVSRFMFMQQKEIFEHQDLVLSCKDFLSKYEQKGYKQNNVDLFDNNAILKMCKFYKSLDGKIDSWQDIPFPRLNDVLYFIKSELNEEIVENIEFDFDSRGLEKNLKEILKLSDQEVDFILNKNKELLKSKDIYKIIFKLVRDGLSFEEVSSLLFKKPSLFLYSYFDFIMLVEEILEEKNLNLKQIVECVL
ncbi:MAG: hypothetical protein IJB98_01655 [Clostridia bacterium]|nr:hypothetical protein [Clostridia bacterium]